MFLFVKKILSIPLKLVCEEDLYRDRDYKDSL